MTTLEDSPTINALREHVNRWIKGVDSELQITPVDIGVLLTELDRRGEVIARVTQLREDWARRYPRDGHAAIQQISRALDGTP